MNDDARDLEELWRAGIPLASAMRLAIEHASTDALTVAADLEPNVNVHGTAFAGSLYAISALTGWGLVWLVLREAGLDGDIVLAHAEIDYRRPVRSRIVCRSVWTGSARADLLGELERSDRAEVRLESAIGGTDRPDVRFKGRYIVRRSSS